MYVLCIFMLCVCGLISLSSRLLFTAFRCVHKIARVTISFVMSVHLSVRPHGTTRLPLDGFSWNLIFECFWKNCHENSSFIKTGQENCLLYMKTTRHFWSYLSQFFLEWEMFRTEFVEEIRTHILCSIIFFWKLYHSWDNMEKYCSAGQATDDNMVHVHCMLDI